MAQKLPDVCFECAHIRDDQKSCMASYNSSRIIRYAISKNSKYAVYNFRIHESSLNC